jgi:hypothetical protein
LDFVKKTENIINSEKKEGKGGTLKFIKRKIKTIKKIKEDFINTPWFNWIIRLEFIKKNKYEKKNRREEQKA